MLKIRVLARSASLLLILITGVALSAVVQRGTMPRRGLAARTTSFWHRCASRALGIDIKIHGEASDVATLYVANHISWFDICALGSHLPLRFLSKAEVKNWPIVGWLASRAGTLYIKRGHHASSHAIDAMHSSLDDDQNVCLFAEGTTTDGNIRKFHSRLIQSAIEADAMIQPVAVFYPPSSTLMPSDTDTDTSTPIHPAVCFTGDTSMKDSFLNMLHADDICVEIHFLDAIDASGLSRDQIAQYCEQQVRDHLAITYDID